MSLLPFLRRQFVGGAVADFRARYAKAAAPSAMQKFILTAQAHPERVAEARAEFVSSPNEKTYQRWLLLASQSQGAFTLTQEIINEEQLQRQIAMADIGADVIRAAVREAAATVDQKELEIRKQDAEHRAELGLRPIPDNETARDAVEALNRVRHQLQSASANAENDPSRAVNNLLSAIGNEAT